MTEPEVRQQLIDATIALLDQQPDPNRITIRQIAQQAGVAIGAINYHFGAKDHLLNEAVGALMAAEAQKWITPGQVDAPPCQRLKQLFISTARVGLRYPELLRFTIAHDLQHGQFTAALLSVPLLRAIYPTHTETELRLLAMALITASQVMYLRADILPMYLGLDPTDHQQLEAGLALLVETLVPDCRPAANPTPTQE